MKQFKNEALMFAAPKRIKRVGVFATRGCIGKFTAQMNLYREFRKSGIPAAALITEPTGFLFGQPEGDIFKFLAHQSLEKYPYYIDAVAHQAERDGMEWIVMAGQSSILPTTNLVFNSVRFAMLQAFDPQYNLLIVGYEDDAQIEAAIQLLSIYSTPPQPCCCRTKWRHPTGGTKCSTGNYGSGARTACGANSPFGRSSSRMRPESKNGC